MTQEPSLPELAKNLSKTTFDIVKGFVFDGHTLLVPEEVKKARMEICQACIHFNAEEVKCRECGCYLNQKTKFSDAHCPHELW